MRKNCVHFGRGFCAPQASNSELAVTSAVCEILPVLQVTDYSVYHGASYGLISTLALRANFAQAIHYNDVLASVPAIHFRLHPPPALSTMPVWQNFPLYRLLGLPQDE